MAICHDDPEVVGQAKLRSDAGIELGPEATFPTSLGEFILPGVWPHLKREWLQRKGRRRVE